MELVMPSTTAAAARRLRSVVIGINPPIGDSAAKAVAEKERRPAFTGTGAQETAFMVTQSEGVVNRQECQKKRASLPESGGIRGLSPRFVPDFAEVWGGGVPMRISPEPPAVPR